MRVVVLYPEGQFRLEKVPKLEIGENPFALSDVLFQVAYCGICGSDAGSRKDQDRKGLKGRSRPMVSGHEISGSAGDIGLAVTDFGVGDQVVGEIVTFYCGKCINYQTGRIDIWAYMVPSDQRIHYVSGGAIT